MKKYLVIYFFTVVALNSYAHDNDSLKHWSVGAFFSFDLGVSLRFPDYPYNGRPFQNMDGYIRTSLFDVAGPSRGIILTNNKNKTINIQAGIFDSKETIGPIGIDIILSNGSSLGGTRIYKYLLNYFTTLLRTKYNFSVKSETNPFLLLGIKTDFLYKEKIDEEDSTGIKFNATNNKFRFNRIIPEIALGCDFFSQKRVSFNLATIFNFRPIYQMRNSYEFFTSIKFSLCFGLIYNF